MLGKPPEQPHLSFEQGSSFTPPPVLFLLSWSNCFNKQNSFLSSAFCPFSCQSLTVSPYAMICFGFPASDFVFRFLLSLRWLWGFFWGGSPGNSVLSQRHSSLSALQILQLDTQTGQGALEIGNCCLLTPSTCTN